jgi:acetylornithine/N-succinyldiaminopimelate aminotransferase
MIMAKGIAGEFLYVTFAISKTVTVKLELGDHCETYCDNPLGCAVAYAVIKLPYGEQHLMERR